MKNLIFDLGGVLMPLDHYLVNKTFASYNPYLPQVNFSSKASEEFEVSKITAHEFRDSVKKHFEFSNFTDLEFDVAWNNLLLPIPPKVIKFLQVLAKKYHLFLLSNTNEIHLKHIREHLCPSANIPQLETLFEKTYYSHLIKMRKPNREIYEYVLQDAQIEPENTCFIDDNEANAEGAKAVGIHGVWLDLKKTDVVQLFQTLNLL